MVSLFSIQGCFVVCYHHCGFLLQDGMLVLGLFGLCSMKALSTSRISSAFIFVIVFELTLLLATLLLFNWPQLSHPPKKNS